MQLITQAELGKHLDLTRQRINQLMKQGIFSYADDEHKLLDRDYCVYRYEKYKEKNIGHIEDRASRKEEAIYQKVKPRIYAELHGIMNSSYDEVVPKVLAIYQNDYNFTDEQLADVDDAIQMFYTFFLPEITGRELSSWNESDNPDRINERNRKALTQCKKGSS